MGRQLIWGQSVKEEQSQYHQFNQASSKPMDSKGLKHRYTAGSHLENRLRLTVYTLQICSNCEGIMLTFHLNGLLFIPIQVKTTPFPYTYK